MAIVPFRKPDDLGDTTVSNVPNPQREGSAIIVHLNGDGAGYDPDTDTVQVQGDDGDVTVSFGQPAPEKKDSDFGDNLAELLGETELTAISEKLMAGIEADEQSRSEWLENAAKGIGLLGLELKAQQGAAAGAAQTPAEGTSNVDHPLLLEAVLRFQANARGELLPADGPVKVRNDGEGNALATQLAQALEKDLNHYLTKTAKEYYPDTDRMLLLLGFSGISFKKGYHDPIKRRPVLASIDAKDLVVSNATTDLDSAGRVTHRILMTPGTLKRMQMVGAYRDVYLPPPPLMPLKNVVDEKIGDLQGIQPVGITYETADIQRELFECYCELEIPGFEHEFMGKASGLPLPYKVVLDKESRKILEIRRNWDEDDVLCLPQNRIIAYVFIPGLGFYGIGLLNVLGNATKAVTAAWRLMLDAGMFSNFPGFLYLKAFAKQLTNQFRVPPGSGMPIDTVGNDIRASVMPLPYKDPSAVFIQLIDNIATVAQRVGGVAELQVGEGKQDAPVGTTLALLEQATKLMSAVHKRLHQAQGQEFELLKQLLMEDPEALWRHNKKSEVFRMMNMQIPELAGIAAQQEQADSRRKQLFMSALADCDLVPAADPNTSSQTERYLKIYALRQMAMTDPKMDMEAVDKRALTVLGFDDVEEFFPLPDPNAPPPPPPPEAVMAQASQMAASARIMDSQTRMQESRIRLAEAQQDAQLKAQEMQSKDQIARLGVAREMVIHQADQQKDLTFKRMDHSHDAQMQAMQHSVDLHKTRMEHEVGIHKERFNRLADMREQGLAQSHEAQQSALDQMHERGGRVHEHYQGMLDRTHEHNQNVLDRQHEHQQNALEHDRQMELQERQGEQQAAQAKEDAKNKPKPAAKNRQSGGRVMFDGDSYDTPAPGTVAEIIASTVKQLRAEETAALSTNNTEVAAALKHVAETMKEVRTADTNNTQVANALRQLAGTMRELRNADGQASKAVNANTFAAINRLSATLNEMRQDKEPKDRQTAAAISQLSEAVKGLREASTETARASDSRTSTAMAQLSEAVRELRSGNGTSDAAALASTFESSLQALRQEVNERHDSESHKTLASIEKLIESIKQQQPTVNVSAPDNSANAALAEQLRKFVAAQVAPRTLVRDQAGRIVGVRVHVPNEAPASNITQGSNGEVVVELEDKK